MRVVHLCSSDSGGAGRACVRLHKSLLSQGIDSIVLTQNKTGDSPRTLRLARTKPQKVIEKVRPFLSQLPLMLYKKRHNDIFSPQLPLFIPRNKLLLKTLDELKPDIVHLHWIESGFINIKDLAQIDAPLLWSMHDANPYTGGCHYVTAACIGVSIGCKKCPLLNANSPLDISYLSFKRKYSTYKKIKNLTINGLSTWIAKCAENSALLKNKTIINLPNPIDCTAFSPVPKSIARMLLNLESPSKIIAFGAINPTQKRKGYDDLKTALSTLKNKASIKLIVFGASSGEQIGGIDTLYLGHLSDDISLKIVYSLADVVLMPSHIESFGMVAAESLACGTPVVAYNTSGLKDIISHKNNGYLAENISDLANGIEWILSLDSTSYEALRANARDSILDRFDANKVAKKYIDLYAKLAESASFDSNNIAKIAKNANGGGHNYYKAVLLSTLYASANLAESSGDSTKCDIGSYAKDSSDFANFGDSSDSARNNDSSDSAKIRYIGFGAIDSVSRKGYNELIEALNLLQSTSYKLIVFGGHSNPYKIDAEIHFLGYLNDDETLKLAYNACDIFVVPSLAENLSNAIMEALSCGVPVVAFDIGGNGDLITHKTNGYLAKDIGDLARGIEWSLDSANYERLSINARNSVLAKFDSNKVAKSYISQYQKMLIGGGNTSITS